MEKSELKSYRMLLKEIHTIEREIEKLLQRQEKLPIIKDTVQDSMKEYPYIRTHTTVDALDPLKNSVIEKLLNKKRRMLKELQKDRLKIESYISSLPDSRTRLIFTAVFVNGRSQRSIAVELGYDESYISKLIDFTLQKIK